MPSIQVEDKSEDEQSVATNDSASVPEQTDPTEPAKPTDPTEAKEADAKEEPYDDGAAVSRPIVADAAAQPKRKKIIMLAAIGVVLVLAGAAAWYMLSNRKTTTTSSRTGTVKEEVKQTEEEPTDKELQAQLTKFTTPTTGETWLATPKQVGKLGYVSASDETDVSYYEVGARGQNIIYLSNTEIIGSSTSLYEKLPDGSVHIIMQPNANAVFSKDAGNGSSVANSLPKGVTADYTTHYDSLSPPNTLSLNQGQKAQMPQAWYAETGDFKSASSGSSAKETVIQTYGASKIVKIESSHTDAHFTAINYALDTPMNTRLYLTYSGLETDMRSYTWNNGVAVADSKNSDDYTLTNVVQGCSFHSAISRVDDVTDAAFAETGKAPDGTVVYAFKDSNAQFVTKMYDEYTGYYGDGTSVVLASREDFLKQHALVFYKNAANEWLAYVRYKYAAIGGCAKPVVYLYPTRAQNVTVKVGANIPVSDPQYKNGWTVFAKPDGTLTLGGKTYGSLFWEGQGYGLYPGITAGTVVKQGAAAATIRQQLGQQGLNQTEINDFMEYWQSRIPNKPYVRLTWLDTAQMNQLAPLYVSPKPDTTIRVFLDMAGYDVPPKLPVQQLSATPRTGFTVVEWGGLTTSGF